MNPVNDTDTLCFQLKVFLQFSRADQVFAAQPVCSYLLLLTLKTQKHLHEKHKKLVRKKKRTKNKLKKHETICMKTRKKVQKT